MSSVPPEPGYSSEPQPMGMAAGPLTGRRMTVSRIVCGIIWGAVAVITAVGGVAELTVGIVGGAVLCFVIAVLAGWYDYRVWTFRARRLWIIL
jgi:hypothetical protein